METEKIPKGNLPGKADPIWRVKDLIEEATQCLGSIESVLWLLNLLNRLPEEDKNSVDNKRLAHIGDLLGSEVEMVLADLEEIRTIVTGEENPLMKILRETKPI